MSFRNGSYGDALGESSNVLMGSVDADKVNFADSRYPPGQSQDEKSWNRTLSSTFEALNPAVPADSGSTRSPTHSQPCSPLKSSSPPHPVRASESSSIYERRLRGNRIPQMESVEMFGGSNVEPVSLVQHSGALAGSGGCHAGDSTHAPGTMSTGGVSEAGGVGDSGVVDQSDPRTALRVSAENLADVLTMSLSPTEYSNRPKGPVEEPDMFLPQRFDYGQKALDESHPGEALRQDTSSAPGAAASTGVRDKTSPGRQRKPKAKTEAAPKGRVLFRKEGASVVGGEKGPRTVSRGRALGERNTPIVTEKPAPSSGRKHSRPPPARHTSLNARPPPARPTSRTRDAELRSPATTPRSAQGSPRSTDGPQRARPSKQRSASAGASGRKENTPAESPAASPVPEESKEDRREKLQAHLEMLALSKRSSRFKDVETLAEDLKDVVVRRQRQLHSNQALRKEVKAMRREQSELASKVQEVIERKAVIDLGDGRLRQLPMRKSSSASRRTLHQRIDRLRTRVSEVRETLQRATEEPAFRLILSLKQDMKEGASNVSSALRRSLSTLDALQHPIPLSDQKRPVAARSRDNNPRNAAAGGHSSVNPLLHVESAPSKKNTMEDVHNQKLERELERRRKASRSTNEEYARDAATLDVEVDKCARTAQLRAATLELKRIEEENLVLQNEISSFKERLKRAPAMDEGHKFMTHNEAREYAQQKERSAQQVEDTLAKLSAIWIEREQDVRKKLQSMSDALQAVHVRVSGLEMEVSNSELALQAEKLVRERVDEEANRVRTCIESMMKKIRAKEDLVDRLRLKKSIAPSYSDDSDNENEKPFEDSRSPRTVAPFPSESQSTSQNKSGSKKKKKKNKAR
eukprot:Rmarinus@m.10483